MKREDMLEAHYYTSDQGIDLIFVAETTSRLMGVFFYKDVPGAVGMHPYSSVSPLKVHD